MKIAVCFLSTIKNHFNYKELKKQANNSKLHKVDIYYYINNEKYDYKYKKKIIYIYFKYWYLKEKLKYNHTYCYTDYIGSTFLCWIDMYYKHKNKYDIYMFYEDDLSYFGKENIFDKINFNSDIIIQSKYFNAKYDNWPWSTYTDYTIENKNYIIYHSLMNIYAANSFFIEGLIKFMTNNFMHHEGLIPTYALNNNYKIDYINKYISLNCTHLNNMNDYNYDLLHPIKTLRKYNKIKQLKNT